MTGSNTVSPTTSDDPLVFTSTKPKVSELINEFKLGSPWFNGENRMALADNTRFCRWAGQSLTDEKKHGTDQDPAMPFEGASDCRNNLADDIIDETVAVKVLAFWRSVLKAQGVEPGDLEQSGHVTRLLEWLIKTKLYKELWREVELSAQYWDTYGWVILNPCWIQEVALKNRELHYEDFLQLAAGLAQQNPESPYIHLPQMLLDPEMDDQTAELMQAIYVQYVKRVSGEVFESDIPELPKAMLRKIIRGLRDGQKSKLPVPYLCRNEPAIFALKPWEEVFFRYETTDIQKARVLRREWVTEVELRARLLTEKYDSAFVLEALKHKGKLSAWNTGGVSIDLNMLTISVIDQKHDLIELWHCHTWQLDENGVPGLYCTVINPHVQRDDLHAKHEIVDYAHGKSPFVAGARERLCRRIMDSRGIPELVKTWQRQEKVQLDGIVDNTSWGTLPSILTPLTSNSLLPKSGRTGSMAVQQQFGPGSQVPYRPGAEPKFMERPPPPVVAFELLEQIARRVNRRFGRFSEDVPPDQAKIKKQKDVTGFLMMWSEAFQQMLALVEQYLPAETWQRVTTQEKPNTTPGEISGQYDVILHFDAGELEQDTMLKKIEAVTKGIVPYDREGVIDIRKLVTLLLRAVDPLFVTELVMEPQSASRKLYKNVVDDLIGIVNGVEPIYLDEPDASAPLQLQVADSLIASNPKWQEAFAGGDQRSTELFENWRKNRMQQAEQIQNKTVGREGVKRVG